MADDWVALMVDWMVDGRGVPVVATMAVKMVSILVA